MTALEKLQKVTDGKEYAALCPVEPKDVLEVAAMVPAEKANHVTRALVKGATGAGNAPRSWVQAGDLRQLTDAAATKPEPAAAG